MRSWFVRAASAAVLGAVCLGAGGPAAVPSARPVPFEPFPLARGTWLQDLAFAPDGRTLYATLGIRPCCTVVVSQRAGAGWARPATAPFSGVWRDLEEVLSPDGREMIFASNRPVRPGGAVLDAFYNGRARRGTGGNLWRVQRSGAEWGTPERLPDAVNASTSTFSPAIAADGTLYFMRATGPRGTFHLFVARRAGGVYRASAPAPFGDPRYAEFDPTLAPDDSYVVFASTRPPSRPKTADLFIAFRWGDGWTTPRDLGRSIDSAGDANEPRIAPDGRTLTFTSAADLTHGAMKAVRGAQRRLWRVDLSPWLAAWRGRS